MEAVSGNLFVSIAVWTVAITFIFLLVVLAGARVDESCRPEHDCSNCGHCTENGLSESCSKCVDAYPATPMWIPIAEAHTDEEAA